MTPGDLNFLDFLTRKVFELKAVPDPQSFQLVTTGEDVYTLESASFAEVQRCKMSTVSKEIQILQWPHEFESTNIATPFERFELC